MKTNQEELDVHLNAYPHSNDLAAPQLPAGALVVALLGGMFLAASPLANQFSPYTGEACFGGALLLLFAAGAAAASLVTPRDPHSPHGLPMSLGIVLLSFAALHFWGLMRAPYFGGALPLAGNVFGYMLVAFAGWLVGTYARPLREVFTRALSAMVIVMAFAALFQIFVELPRLRSQVESGALPTPDSLTSSLGLARLYGDEAFVTFGNPNSLAAYLVMGFLIFAGTRLAVALRHRLRNSRALIGPHALSVPEFCQRAFPIGNFICITLDAIQGRCRRTGVRCLVLCRAALEQTLAHQVDVRRHRARDSGPDSRYDGRASSETISIVAAGPV